MSKTYVFECDAPGDASVGIRSYRDTVTVTVESGDPGGSPGEFEEYMRESLQGWIDSGVVTLIEPREVKGE